MYRDQSQIASKGGARGLALAAVLAAAVLAAVVMILPDSGEGSRGIAERPDAAGGEADRGAAPGDRTIEENAPAGSSERILLRPRAPGESAPVRVHGHVLDPEGASLAAAGVAFRSRAPRDEDGMLEGAVESGPDGSYGIVLAAGAYTVLAAAGSQRAGHDLWFEPRTVVVPAVEEFVLDIRFARPLCRILGSVTRPGGAPIEGVGVGLCTPDARFLRKTDTAGDGTFSFESVAPGTYRLLFEQGPDARRLSFPWRRSHAPETSPDRWPLLSVGPGESEIALHLTLAATVKVTGMVLGRGMEIPGSGRLFIREDSNEGSRFPAGRRRLYSASINDDGSFLLLDVFPGAYLACLHGLDDGFARPDPVPILVDPYLPEQNLSISFEPSAGACRLAGRVADQEGRGLDGARVLVWDEGARPADPTLFRVYARAEAVCDEKGGFAINGLRPGRYLLAREKRVLASGPPIVIDRARDLAVTLAEGEESRVLVEVRAFEKTAVRGRVQGLDSALPLRAVAAFDAGGDFERYQTHCPVGVDGDFLLSHVPRVEEDLVVEILADLGGGGEIPCARTSVALEDKSATDVILAREE